MDWNEDFRRERTDSLCSSTHSSDIDEVECNLYSKLYFDHNDDEIDKLCSVELLGCSSHPSVQMRQSSDSLAETSASTITDNTLNYSSSDTIHPLDTSGNSESDCDEYVNKQSSTDDDSVIMEEKDTSDIMVIAHYNNGFVENNPDNSVITVSDSSEDESLFSKEWSVREKKSYTKKFLDWHKEISRSKNKMKSACEKMQKDYDSDSSTEFSLNKLWDDMPERGWSLKPQDLYVERAYRYHSKPRVRCNNCQQTGHISKHCPDPTRIPKCYICAGIDHSGFRCPNRICPRCFGPKSHRMCSVSLNLVCKICNCPGHETRSCPDLWRRYHVTTSVSEDLHIIRTPPSSLTKIKPRSKQFCYNCCRRGHFGFECNNGSNMEKYCSWPYIVSYSDPLEHLKSLGQRVSNQSSSTLVLPCLTNDADNGDLMFEEVMELSSEKIGKVIGKSGGNIKSLTEKSGAKLEVVGSSNGKQHYVHVVGKSEQVRVAKSLLEKCAGIKSLKRVNAIWADPSGVHSKRVRFNQWISQNDLVSSSSEVLSSKLSEEESTSSKYLTPNSTTSYPIFSKSVSETNRQNQQLTKNSKPNASFLNVLLNSCNNNGGTPHGITCGCCYYLHRATSPCECSRDFHVTLPRAKSQMISVVQSTLTKAKNFQLGKMSMVLKKLPPLLEQLSRKLPKSASKGSREKLFTCVKRINLVYYGTFEREGVKTQVMKDLLALKKSQDIHVPEELRERLLSNFGKMTSGHNCVGVVERLNYLMSQGVGLKSKDITIDNNSIVKKNKFRVSAQELILDRRCMELIPAKLVNVKSTITEKYGLWPIKNEYHTDHNKRAAAEELNNELRVLFDSHNTQVKLTKDERIYLGKLVLKVQQSF